ncbi:MAG: phosphoribosylaminoimidazolesuccinocarboxamide synthase [Chloroflexi bacterium]|nr:phosphoribosylaminoimidazolesuccinocarboxamide synthase [Chloroflexota bacterium]
MIRHPFLDGGEAPPPLGEIGLPELPLLARGKVREIYDLGNRLLLVATDRVSAFDVILPEPIPGKGIVLSSLSAFWFERFRDVVPNHFLSDDPADWPPEVKPHADRLLGRAMLVQRCQRLDVECVVRGYLAGSGWAEYRQQGTLAGEPLPAGLVEAARLPEPRFTPSTKAAKGHDEPITRRHLAEMVGQTLAAHLEELSLLLYRRAHEYALARGIILADTKFEFGLLGDRVLQIDESLTPDSSRFWPAVDYRPGRTPPSLDKQPIRDLLDASGWDRRPPPPHLSAAVVHETSERYREAFRRLAGSSASIS